MDVRNIDKMYYNYGFGSGFCHECPHFRKKCWNKKATRRVVGSTNEGKPIYEYESFIACGLIGKEYPDLEAQLPGQMTMDMVKAVG